MEKLVIGLAVTAALMGARMMTHPAESSTPEHRTDPTAAASTTIEPLRTVQDTSERPADPTATASSTMASGSMAPMPTVQDPAERRAVGAATILNAMAPLSLGSQSTLTGAKADGRTIELDIQLSQNMPTNIPEDAFDRGLVAATCIQKTIGDLLAQGGAVRYAIATPDGRMLNPVTVSSCPAAG